MAINIYNWTKEIEINVTSFDSWVASLGVTNKSLMVGTDITITGNLTLSSIDLTTFANNAKFQGTGKTLTITKMSAIPRHQIFDTGLNVIFNSGAVSFILPEWFGSGNGNILIGNSINTPLSKVYVEGGVSIGDNVTAGSGNLWVTGSGVFNGVVHGATPTVNTHLTSKLYVDTASGALNTYITNASGQLSTRINNSGAYSANISGQLSTRINDSGTYANNMSGQLNSYITNVSGQLDNRLDGLEAYNPGTGTSGVIPKFISTSGFGPSIISENNVTATVSGSLTITATGKFGNDTTNYSIFNEKGFYSSYGSGMAWDDIRIVGDSVGLGASAPDKINLIGSGLLIYGFDGGVQLEQVYFSCQVSHDCELNPILYPHLHYCPTTTATGVIKWNFQYSWADIDGTFSSPTTLSGLCTASGEQWKHKTCNFPNISGYGSGLSSMLMCRLWRDPQDSQDTYTDDVGFLEFDFHYRKNSIGSASELVK
jgi:hypothetical protein